MKQAREVREVREVREHNDRIEALRAGVAPRDRASVEAYLQLVLDRTLLPTEVPHRAEVAYSPRGEQAVVRFELPSPDAVPMVSAHTYVATTGETKDGGGQWAWAYVDLAHSGDPVAEHAVAEAGARDLVTESPRDSPRPRGRVCRRLLNSD